MQVNPTVKIEFAAGKNIQRVLCYEKEIINDEKSPKWPIKVIFFAA